MARDNQDWKPEEKLEIVFEGLERNRNVTTVCKKHGISRDTYYTWKKQLSQGACTYWEEQSVGRKGKHSFSTKSEAEAAYVNQARKLEEAHETKENLLKKLEGVTLQRDFTEFRLSLREQTQKKTTKPKRKNGS